MCFSFYAKADNWCQQAFQKAVVVQPSKQTIRLIRHMVEGSALVAGSLVFASHMPLENVTLEVLGWAGILGLYVRFISNDLLKMELPKIDFIHFKNMNALFKAIRDNDLKKVKQAIKDIQLTSVQLTSPEIMEHAKNNNPEEIPFLIKKITAKNATEIHELFYNQNFQGDSVYHAAVRSKNFDIVEALMEADFDMYALNEEGETPAELAKKLGYNDIAELIDSIGNAHYN